MNSYGSLFIGSKRVGESVIVIAEVGVNHNGSLRRALRLVDEAAKIGADAVKFQTFAAEKVISRVAPKADYQMKTFGKTQLEMAKALELKQRDFREISRRAQRRGLIFLSTPFDEESVDLLEDLGVPAYKVGSGDLTNLPFLRYIARKKKPMIVSTGMSDMEEVREAVSVIENEGNDKIILLHCVSSYPAKPADVNLRAMQTLREKFNLPVGFSDHTMGIEVALAAAALGAVMLEKHFTLSRRLLGPDHKSSLEPREFKQMVRGIRIIDQALGSPLKAPSKEELKMRDVARRSIVASNDIPNGARITEDMVAFKRPGTGIAPRDLGLLLGKQVKREIKRDEVLKWEMVE